MEESTSTLTNIYTSNAQDTEGEQQDTSSVSNEVLNELLAYMLTTLPTDATDDFFHALQGLTTIENYELCLYLKELNDTNRLRVINALQRSTPSGKQRFLSNLRMKFQFNQTTTKENTKIEGKVSKQETKREIIPVNEERGEEERSNKCEPDEELGTMNSMDSKDILLPNSSMFSELTVKLNEIEPLDAVFSPKCITMKQTTTTTETIMEEKPEMIRRHSFDDFLKAKNYLNSLEHLNSKFWDCVPATEDSKGPMFSVLPSAHLPPRTPLRSAMDSLSLPAYTIRRLHRIDLNEVREKLADAHISDMNLHIHQNEGKKGEERKASGNPQEAPTNKEQKESSVELGKRHATMKRERPLSNLRLLKENSERRLKMEPITSLTSMKDLSLNSLEFETLAQYYLNPSDLTDETNSKNQFNSISSSRESKDKTLSSIESGFPSLEMIVNTSIGGAINSGGEVKDGGSLVGYEQNVAAQFPVPGGQIPSMKPGGIPPQYLLMPIQELHPVPTEVYSTPVQQQAQPGEIPPSNIDLATNPYHPSTPIANPTGYPQVQYPSPVGATPHFAETPQQRPVYTYYPSALASRVPTEYGIPQPPSTASYSPYAAQQQSQPSPSQQPQRTPTGYQRPPTTTPSTSMGTVNVGKRWTDEQDNALRRSVHIHGEKNWKAIAKLVPGRNHAQCLQRWRKVLRPGLVKGHWGFEEDQILETLVRQGCNNWGQISEQITGRTPKQCRERWRNHLDPRINKGPYTAQEDAILLDQQAKIGNKWSQISQLLPGRTEDSVKIRWKSLTQNAAKHSASISQMQATTSSCHMPVSSHPGPITKEWTMPENYTYQSNLPTMKTESIEGTYPTVTYNEPLPIREPLHDTDENLPIHRKEHNIKHIIKQVKSYTKQIRLKSQKRR